MVNVTDSVIKWDTMNMFEALYARQKQEAEDKIYFSSATSQSGGFSKPSSTQDDFQSSTISEQITIVLIWPYV